MNDFSVHSLRSPRPPRPPIDPCEPHRITLSAALDGELQGASAALEMAETVPHLAGCAACQEFVRRARALDAVLAADALGDESPTSGWAINASSDSGGSASSDEPDPSVPPVPRALWKRIEAEAWASERATAARKERWAWRVAAGLLLALAGVGLWNSVAERPVSAEGHSAGIEGSSREGREMSEFERQPDNTATATSTTSSPPLRFGS